MNNYYCYFCQKQHQTTTFNQIPSTIKIINGNQFTFFNCLKCKQSIYYWKYRNKIYFGPKIHIVLLEPEIVGNVGTIIRLAANFNFGLHLIQPFGFIYSKKWLKRSSANHLDAVKPFLYQNWQQFYQTNSPRKLFFTSSQANQPLNQISFRKIGLPIYIVFGKESTGLPAKLLNNSLNNFRIETTKISSINLANSVALTIYRVLTDFEMLNLIL